MRSRHTATNPTARWISVFALVALLAMAVFSTHSDQRAVAAADTMHWNATWHG